MKITFEGPNFHSILVQIRGLLAAAEPSPALTDPAPTFQGSGPDVFTGTEAGDGDNPVDTPVEKPPATDRMAKVRAAKGAKKAAEKDPVEELKQKAAAQQAAANAKAPTDPAEVVKLRTKTIEDLQTAYANGHQAEVFELLARFGNGAKSFRELPPEAFLPIRDAIDKGALT